MIDIDTHNVIDMIGSRDCTDVAEWLKTFPNIKVVSRDGSITYKNAISKAHPKAIQVSDRFHLLKNLTTYAKDYLMKILKAKVPIEASEVKMIADNISELKTSTPEKLTLKEKCDKIDSLIEKGYLKNKICKTLKMDIRTLDKLILMNDNERNSVFKSKKQLKHEENMDLKLELINEVRNMFKQGFSRNGIAVRLKISRKSVINYLDPKFSVIHGHYGVKRKGLLTPYFDEINTYAKQGYTVIKILEIISSKGYKGSNSTVSHYITDWKVIHKSTYLDAIQVKRNSEIIERKTLIQLLYRPIDKIKNLSSNQLNKVFIEYPIYSDIISVVEQFRKLLAKRRIEELDTWINDVINLKIRELNSFIHGITKDLSAVKNAIIYDYNNGLAEGSVNKLKVIKRIMYGRCNFDTFRNKVLRLELIRKIN